ncbi:MAG: hypothetical protein V4628_14235 [Pseudomonadota bacterium]
MPRSRWTHEAHLVAGFWYANKYEPDQALNIIREYIWRHNESVGTENTDSGGYHETITRLYMTVIANHVLHHKNLTFEESLALLLASPLGNSEWPLTHYSKRRLFSVEARRAWLEPDLQPLLI